MRIVTLPNNGPAATAGDLIFIQVGNEKEYAQCGL